MADNTPAYDDEARALQLEAEKAAYRLEIAHAEKALDETTAPAAAEIPSVEGAPTGAVTVGENAGAFGPWLAQRSLEACADEIADAALPLVQNGRTLVVEGRTVAAGSYAAQWVIEQIARADEQLTHARDAVDQITPPAQRSTGAPLPEGVDADYLVEEEVGGTIPSAPVTAGLSSAIGLLGMVGADFSISATPVTTSTERLAVLTTGSLAAKGVDVELSDFGQLAWRSPVMSAAANLARRIDAIARGLARADAVMAQPRANVTRLRAAVTLLEDAWKAALAGKAEEAAARLAAIRPELEAARKELAAAEDAITTKDSTLAGAKESLTNASTILAALSAPGSDGTVPLRTAVLYERLTASTDDRPSITHVLFVSADAAGADIVTRRVLLGESGRVSFLGGVNNSWALLDVDSHRVVAAGPVSNAQRMVFDLGSGKSSVEKVSFDTLPSPDPFEKVATWSRNLLIALCLFLVLMGAAQVIEAVK